MRTVDANWIRAIKIAWYCLWRTILAAYIISRFVGLLLALFVAPFWSYENIDVLIFFYANTAGLAAGIIFGIWALKSLPEKNFSDFRVILIAPEPQSTND